MIYFPNAKINLGLNIVEKRADGFHNLETIFYPVPWADALEIVKAPVFEFKTSGLTIDGSSENNLCIKVYQKMKEKYNLSPVHMHLHKVIPTGAGLGGGSSDAAFTVRLLNDIFELKLSPEEMEDLVRPLGSDCAFFVRNQPVYAYEKGDRFEAISLSLAGKWILLVYPGLHVSTKEAYDGITPRYPEKNIRDIVTTKLPEWKNLLVNDFEITILSKYPEILKVKETLYDAGAVYASMSGSGSAVFGIFDRAIRYDHLFPTTYKTQAGVLS